jgi:hypothetical protein
MANKIHIRWWEINKFNQRIHDRSRCHYRAADILVNLDKFLGIKDIAPELLCKTCVKIAFERYGNNPVHPEYEEYKGMMLLAKLKNT